MAELAQIASRSKKHVSLSTAARAAAILGVVLYVAGVVAQVAMHHPFAGTALRWIALVVLLVPVFHRQSLTLWTFFAMLAGTETGIDFPRVAAHLHVVGAIFLRLIRLIVAPLIFGTLTTSIAGHAHLKQLGRIALKTLIYFEVVTTLGLLIGMAAINLTQAGTGIPMPEGQPSLSASPEHSGWENMVLNIFPENIAQAVAQNQILQIAVFAVLFGVAMALVPMPKRQPMLSVLESLTAIMFRLARLIMYLAPFAAGAALAYTVGSAGTTTLLSLAKLVATYYGALVFFSLCAIAPVLYFLRIPVRGFADAAGEPAAIAFATTSSEAALPVALDRMREFGVPASIASFVIPTGYSFNMDGSSIYLTIGAIFAAQVGGIHLSLGQQLVMLFMLVLMSKGIAGVPRATLVLLMAAASTLAIPSAPILMLLGIDALMDMGRSAMNAVGNCAASVVIARWENEFPARPSE